MEVIGEGATATVRLCEENPAYVVKLYKRGVRQHELAQELERAMHAEIAGLLAGAQLRVPKLQQSRVGIVMERVVISAPLADPDVWSGLRPELQTAYIEVLAHGLHVLGLHGYQMRDVEVYVQPNESLLMLDFGRVGKLVGPVERRLHTAAMVPPSEVKRLEEQWLSLTQLA